MLVKCYECGGQVSDKATACPHCGAPKKEPPPAAEVKAKNKLIRKQKIESIILNFRKGLSSYEDIHGLMSNWLFYSVENGSVSSIMNDDEVACLILEWIRSSVLSCGLYTFNTPAILTLESLEKGLEIRISESTKNKVIAYKNDIAKMVDAMESKYGKLERSSCDCHFIKS